MDFAEYNEHTEELIRWLLARLTEDEVLAGAVRPRFGLRFDLWSIRDAVNGYRKAVYKVVSGGRGWRWLWLLLARYHALCLRQASRMYADRGGFDRAWLRPPQRR
jgi:hypothetical protein